MVSKAELKGEFFIYSANGGDSYPVLYLLDDQSHAFKVSRETGGGEYTLAAAEPKIAQKLQQRRSNTFTNTLFQVGTDPDKLRNPGSPGTFSVDELTFNPEGNITHAPIGIQRISPAKVKLTTARQSQPVDTDTAIIASPSTGTGTGQITRNRLIFSSVTTASIGGIFSGLARTIGAAAAAAVTAVGTVLGVAVAVVVGDQMTHKDHGLMEALQALTRPKTSWRPALDAVLAKVDGLNLGK